MASPSLPPSVPTPLTSAQPSVSTFSAENLAGYSNHWPRVGIYLTCSIAVFFMLLRTYARVMVIKCFGLDDLLMMFAVVIKKYMFFSQAHSDVVTRFQFPFPDMRRYRYAILE
jgi:hypothetical protein